MHRASASRQRESCHRHGERGNLAEATTLLCSSLSYSVERRDLTSCAGTTCHLFSQIANIFSVLSVFKCNPGKTNDKSVTS